MGKGAPRHPPNCLNSLPCPQFRFNQFPLRNTFFYITIKLNRGLLTLPLSLCIDCLPTMSNGSWIVLLWTAQRPQQRVKSCEPIETTPSHILHRDINRSEEKQEQQQQQHYQQQQRKHPEPSSISRWSSSSALLFFCAYPAIHSRAGGHLTSLAHLPHTMTGFFCSSQVKVEEEEDHISCTELRAFPSHQFSCSPAMLFGTKKHLTTVDISQELFSWIVPPTDLLTRLHRHLLCWLIRHFFVSGALCN